MNTGPDDRHSGIAAPSGPDDRHSGIAAPSGPDDRHSDIAAPSGPDDRHSGIAAPSGPDLHPAAQTSEIPVRWLVLANADGPIDPARLFPEVDVRLEGSSAAFGAALAASDPLLVVLVAPPAGISDLETVAAWRAVHHESCAVLLSPHQSVAVRLHALELGFDDAIDLSSDPMEVVGRLSIAGRRSFGTDHLPEARVPIGDGVELDLRARAVRREGRLLSLRPKELSLLHFLVSHPGTAFTREELLRHVWHGTVENERMVDVYVFWLRAKVERDPSSPEHLLTVRGSGYLFEPPDLSGAYSVGRER